ncbi:uncharacterized protein LOC119991532 [Tripterygium wilfordii]|uniref:uncharacterized protein LOC119991532 n=1 Tax=Tripterygium wilfordii TaxID=458696 RepID=UPI0018F85BD1|nr:uncharacterized protein LOC119991532 [Tripterygium wilfordii]
MDATYKTNRYSMPLLEIVSVTATNMTFCIAFVFLHSEKVFNYTWALRWHIYRSILSKYRSSITDNETWNAFFKMWTKLLESETENAYVCNLADLEEMFVSAWTNKYLHFGNQTTNRVKSQHAKLKRYLESSQSDLVTSLSFIHHVIQSQDIAIKANIEQSKTIVQHRFNIPHFQELCGFVSIHALHLILKKFEQSKNAGEVSYKCGCQIRTSYGLPCAHEQAIYLNDGQPIPINSIDNFWRKLDLSPCVSLQDDDIDCVVDLQVFTKQFKQQTRHGKFNLLRKLREIITPSTTLIREPVVKTNTCGRPSSKKKVTSNTRANPSALVFVESDSPHSQEPSRHNYSFGGLDSKSREDISTLANMAIFEFVELDIFQFQEPVRHSCSSTYNYSVHAYVRQFPPTLHPYIMHVQYVKPYGNCGFRAIAVYLGLHEDAWAAIRYNLIEELHIFRTQYVAIFGSDDQWTRVYNSLNFFALDRGAPIEHWMTMPDMDLLIASKFNVILHVLSATQSFTYFPLRSTPPPSYQHITIYYSLLLDGKGRLELLRPLFGVFHVCGFVCLGSSMLWLWCFEVFYVVALVFGVFHVVALFIFGACVVFALELISSFSGHSKLYSK